VPLASTNKLRQEIERTFTERPFAIEFWDGSRVPSTNGDGPTFSVRSPKAIAHLIRAPGQLGIGRAYVSGALEPDDLDAAMGLIDHWRAASDRRQDAGEVDDRGGARGRPHDAAACPKGRAFTARQAPFQGS